MDSGSVVHVVTIEGGIGAGKSSALEKLKSSRTGIYYIDEPVDLWEKSGLLAAMYSKTINSAVFQIAALATRMAPLLKAVREGHRLIVTERCPWSDIETFTKANLDESSVEFAAYKMAFDSLMTAMPEYKLHIIYLQAPVDTLMERIDTRGRAAEKTNDTDARVAMRGYLEKLQLRHDAFFSTPLAETRSLIDATQTADVVATAVLEAVNSICPVKLE